MQKRRPKPPLKPFGPDRIRYGLRTLQRRGSIPLRSTKMR
jgi:hypothetical protein